MARKSKIKARNGTKAQLEGLVGAQQLELGELGFTTDTEQLIVGEGSGDVIHFPNTGNLLDVAKSAMGLDYIVDQSGVVGIDCDYTNLPTTLEGKAYGIRPAVYTISSDVTYQNNTKVIGIGEKGAINLEFAYGAGIHNSRTNNNVLWGNNTIDITRNSRITQGWSSLSTWGGTLADAYVMFHGEWNSETLGTIHSVEALDTVNDEVDLYTVLQYPTTTNIPGYVGLINLTRNVTFRNLTLKFIENDVGIKIDNTVDLTIENVDFLASTDNTKAGGAINGTDAYNFRITDNNVEGFRSGGIGCGRGLGGIITNNIVTASKSQGGGGVSLTSTHNTILANNLIAGCYAYTTHGGGINLWNSSSNIIEHNIVNYNEAQQYGGGMYVYGNRNTISGNDLRFNRSNIAASTYDGHNLYVPANGYNYIHGNRTTMRTAWGGNSLVIGANNTSADNVSESL